MTGCVVGRKRSGGDRAEDCAVLHVPEDPADETDDG
jgi:hypothetical protein